MKNEISSTTEDFCGQFEKILETIKTIRRLKSEQKIGNKQIDCAHIYLKNDEIFLGMVLESIKDVAILAKCKSIIIVYFDDVNVENGMVLYYSGDKDQTYVSSVIPNIVWDDLATPKVKELYDLVNSEKFICVP